MTNIIRIAGTMVPVRGNDIDTDRIIPARYLKEITFERMGEYAFYDERFGEDGTPTDHPFNRYKGASILVANANFGCGSSREHAAQAVMRWGIRAIVAESYGEIFAGNCTMIGVPPVVASQEVVEALQTLAEARPEARVEIDLEEMVVRGEDFSYPVSMPEGRREAFLKGYWDSTALLLSNLEKTRKVAAGLPYVRGFE
ncbi:3-isopropylmalate dehydratase, small subunit [Spirochaeta thermophila DSM 6578]|uniref:3-isopropylmalate dehydratase n=1 Tax=Winmispira thermophila (strain ATCC 700085 / DSM 6578 / Z-1203) TaxID=869211 RepID=G0GC35_WINT7|nr:3-isopropylmalate dehydratase small subunit [Spirochaeta thermophila]AEJ60399.1 3-isopropylmalate dehydratase, small subunit [Spirochaeta thermophila DSM 6578]